MHIYARFSPDGKGEVPILRIAQKKYTDLLGKSTHLKVTMPGSDTSIQSLTGDDMDDEEQDIAVSECRNPAGHHYVLYAHPAYPTIAGNCNPYPKIPEVLCYKATDRYLFIRVLLI